MYEQDLKKVVISNKHRKKVLIPLLMVFSVSKLLVKENTFARSK